jgi:hypothetical protein
VTTEDSRAEVVVEWAERVVAAEDDRADAEEDARLRERLVAVLAELAALTLDLRSGGPLPDDCLSRAIRQWLHQELAELDALIERVRNR